MTTFQRARSEEQRAERRQVILTTAAAMLTEMPVAQVSLNELSRRVGLAKSNVLRYFESREAVLLDLLDSASQDWLGGFRSELDAAVDPAAALPARVDQVVTTLAESFAAHPVLCDLIGNQAAVLEHNVSPEVAERFKRSAVANVTLLGTLIEGHLPELGPDDAARFAAVTVMMTGAAWIHSRPAHAMLAVYDAHPDLAAMRIDFTTTLRDLLRVAAAGLLALAAAWPASSIRTDKPMP